MHSWHRCPGTGKLQKYRMYCKECWIHHIMAVTFKLNRLAHIIKLRKQNCMQVTKPSCTLVGAKSPCLLLEHEYRWRQQNCWTRHDGQREGSIVVSAMDKGRRNLWVNWFTEWWYELLSWLCTLLSCQSILCISDGPHSSAMWITAFALFIPFWTANITSPTVSKPLYIS